MYVCIDKYTYIYIYIFIYVCINIYPGPARARFRTTVCHTAEVATSATGVPRSQETPTSLGPT